MELKFIIALCLCSVAGLGFAENTYTLEQCKEKALSSNIRIRQAEMELHSAEQERKSAFTQYFPSISASGTGFLSNKGLLELEMSPEISMSMLKNGVMGGVSATQPLFAGGQIVNGNRLSKIGVEAGRLQQEQAVDEVELTVESYFWQIVSVKEKLKTVAAVKEMLERLETEVNASVEAGVATRNDLLQVQLKKNDMESSRSKLVNALALCKMALAQYAGFEEADFDVRSDIRVGELIDFPMNLKVDGRDALGNTAEYRLLEKNVEAERLKHKLEVGRNLPSVAVGAGYFYDDLMDKSHSFVMGFATVSIPLSGWWGGSHAVKKQKMRLKYAEEEWQNGGELLLVRMQKSWNGVDDAYKQMQISVESIAQSQENLRLNENYYKAGTVTMSDLLEAQSLYRQSCDGYVDAYVDFQIKKLEYLQATGR